MFERSRLFVAVGAGVLLLSACTSNPPESTTEGSSHPPVVDFQDAATDPVLTDEVAEQLGVVVSSAEWDGSGIVVSAWVPGIESDGTCTLTATGPTTASTSGPAYPSASTTSCEQLVLPHSELSSGVWNVTVTFVSSSTQRTSDPVEIEVP